MLVIDHVGPAPGRGSEMTIVGSGSYRYERVPVWPKVPKYLSFGQPSDAAVNSAGEIFVVSRGDHPVTIWTADGDFLGSWGGGLFSAVPHGIYIGSDDNVWIVDRDYHVATEFTPDGKALRTLGQKLSPSPTCTGRVVRARPFNMPTNLAIAPSGEIFVADGYGNHKVHRFTPDGELLHSWGKQGDGPGEFALVHNIWIDRRGRVLVCDDENDRVQIFDQEGHFLDQWKLANPSGLCIHNDIVYIAELQPFHDEHQGPGSGGISIFTLDGRLLTRWLGTEGSGRDVLLGPHDLCVDSIGDIYVCEVRGTRISKFRRIDRTGR
jgi:DNA-binding beta-propeller fold protein YncE